MPFSQLDAIKNEWNIANFSMSTNKDLLIGKASFECLKSLYFEDLTVKKDDSKSLKSGAGKRLTKIQIIFI